MSLNPPSYFNSIAAWLLVAVILINGLILNRSFILSCTTCARFIYRCFHLFSGMFYLRHLAENPVLYSNDCRQHSVALDYFRWVMREGLYNEGFSSQV